ncbi:MAG: universal stress protein [Kofleriaceae bacterium]
MNFTKILCPIDFSSGSQRAMELAIQLATRANTELVLLHSAYVPTHALSIESYPTYLVEDLVAESQRRLDAAVGEAIAAGAKNTTGVLANGPPWSDIVATLESQPFDLCVIGTHGRTGLSRILLGSVAEKVIRHAPCSVLAIRPDSQAVSFSRILVPTDFSDSSSDALDLAAQLVRPEGTITLLHVLELPVMWSGKISDELAGELDRRATAALDAMCSRLETARVTAVSRIGYPGAQTLAALDDDHSIDLVVMGSHGRTGLRRMLLGSVAEKVVRHARCPVLVARRRQ